MSMKRIVFFRSFGLLLWLSVWASPALLAQSNYKQPQVTAKGEFLDTHGIKQGWISAEGIIQNAKGEKVAFLDGQGNLTDATGKKIGRVAKNGAYYDAKGNVLLTVSTPKGEQCQVLDPKGKVVAQLHNNYKMQGACMVHCLASNMKMKP